jgi:diaminopimelate decarboxylase
VESWPRDGAHALSAAEIHALAEEYGTPLYIYDADAVNERIRRIRKAFDQRIKVFYAVKANPNLELLRALRDVADGLDISSAGELEQAVLAGFDLQGISFAGPAKTAAELSLAIGKGVGCISVESVRELQQCIELARSAGIRANIALRVNPQLLNRSFGLKMGGKAVQFGIDEEDIDAAMAIVLANGAQLAFRGVHVYAGSQCFDAAAIVEGVANTFQIVRRIESRFGVTCRTINLGGGFGVSHGENDRELDLATLASALLPVVCEFDSPAGEREMIFELGRFLTASAGIYITRVISKKYSRGTTFVVVDGGLHHHLIAAGTFGATLRSNYAMRNLSRPHAPVISCTIAGSSCNPTDLLGIDVELPQPEIGDLIAVLKSGSYSYTASPLLFLGRRTPVELVRRSNRIVLGRSAKTITDFN